MTHGNYLEAKEYLLSLESSYKQLDITSQLTQLSALIKLKSTLTINSSTEKALDEAIERRKLRMHACLQVVLYEESQWTENLMLARSYMEYDEVNS